MNHIHDRTNSSWRGRAHQLAAMATLIMLAAAVLLWAWKAVAVGIFAAPALRYADSLALTTALALLALTMAKAAALGGMTRSRTP